MIRLGYQCQNFARGCPFVKSLSLRGRLSPWLPPLEDLIYWVGHDGGERSFWFSLPNF